MAYLVRLLYAGVFLPEPRFHGGSETSLKRLARLVLRDGLVASPLLPEMLPKKFRFDFDNEIPHRQRAWFTRNTSKYDYCTGTVYGYRYSIQYTYKHMETQRATVQNFCFYQKLSNLFTI